MAYDKNLDKVLKELQDVDVCIVPDVVDHSFKFRLMSYNGSVAKLSISKTYKNSKSDKVEETNKLGRIPGELIPQFIDRLNEANEYCLQTE